MPNQFSQPKTLGELVTSLDNLSLDKIKPFIADLSLEMSLDTLYKNETQHFFDVHHQIIDLLAVQLREGQTDLEFFYFDTVVRLADRLTVVQDKFIELVASIDDVPLHEEENQQHFDYYLGLSKLFQGQLEDCRVIYNELLVDDLALQLRGRIVNSLAVCCVELGLYEEAIVGYKQSMEIWQTLGNTTRVVYAEKNLGSTYREIQRLDEARFYLTRTSERNLELAIKDSWALIQNQLGLLEVDSGNWSIALAHYENALAHWQQLNSGDNYAAVLLNIGRLDLLRGDFDESRRKHQEVIQFSTNGTDQIESYLDLGLIAQIKGNFTEAENAYKRALEIAEERKDILPRIHYQIAELFCHMGRSTDAIRNYEKAVEIIEVSRGFIARNEALRISFLGRWQQVYEALVLHCIEIGDREQAFKWAERARARTFAEALGSIDMPEQTVVELSDVQATLLPNIAMLCYFTTGVLEQDIPMLQRLQQEAIFREHLLTEPETILFIITQNDLQVHRLGDPNRFVFPVENIEHVMTSPVLQGMHQILLGPFSERNDYNQIYITPHGPLHHIPFAALLDAADQPWLREQGPALAYTPSPTLFVQNQLNPRDSEPIGNAYAMGYNGQDLRYAETEAGRVAQITSGIAQVGSDIQKEQLQHNMAQYRLLHFSCHAHFDVQEPMNSFLEIGPDQRLTATEILQEWQLEADLVVLSACQTGISKILRSDEPMGLVRAFLYAGCKAVLVTSWPVEDLPTLLFMETFYQRLVDSTGEDLPSALKDAQIRLRQLTMAEISLITQTWDHVPKWEENPDDDLCPFENAKHWAAFVLIGA